MSMSFNLLTFKRAHSTRFFAAYLCFASSDLRAICSKRIRYDSARL